MHAGEFLPPPLVLASYWTRARMLGRRGRPVPAWRQGAFAVGIVIVVAVQIPPLDQLADDVLVAHTAQHPLNADIASFLIVTGLTGPLLAPLLQVRATRWLRPLTHPVAALVIGRRRSSIPTTA